MKAQRQKIKGDSLGMGLRRSNQVSSPELESEIDQDLRNVLGSLRLPGESHAVFLRREAGEV